jgi:hypothetical protein
MEIVQGAARSRWCICAHANPCMQLSACRLLPKQSSTGRLLPMGRPAILHARRQFGVAATATMEEYEGLTATSGVSETIEVDSSQVVDESLKIANCNLQPETVKVRTYLARSGGPRQLHAVSGLSSQPCLQCHTPHTSM